MLQAVRRRATRDLLAALVHARLRRHGVGALLLLLQVLLVLHGLLVVRVHVGLRDVSGHVRLRDVLRDGRSGVGLFG